MFFSVVVPLKKILLMEEILPVEGGSLSVYPIIFMFYTSQVVSRISSINSIRTCFATKRVATSPYIDILPGTLLIDD